ncbi:ABC transporter permease [Conexibacter stalactiti]|uniref:ABC transporter permease n=1 Tax=Conexibacter stalactiti TaxID=1940611 RepID=A0ABU4HLC6_9ACTN|nr:ABC transporter permease [Conexibacter stalactiti]MDW5594107.1 ABC transporter permease [Conexibacter stalactiti]MEC5034749.1 ABC transporter permease [Conexibacter stalactiti]
MSHTSQERLPTRASTSARGWPATALRIVNERVGVVGTALLVALVAELIVFSALSPYFFDGENFSNIGRAMTIVGIGAIGQTIVIIAGGFDLSVGSVMAAAGMLAAYLVTSGVATPLALAGAIVLGACVGLLNGAVTSYLRINPLITTLATLAIVRGVAFVISGGEAEVVSDRLFLDIGTNEIAGVPLVVVLLLALFLAVGFVLPRTRFGRYAYAIGSNARGARLAGVAVHRWRLAFYGLAGLLAAVAGCVTVARTGQAEPAANIGIELDVITAVILGGTSLNGGRGRLFGTFLGLTVLAVLNNGLILAGVESYWQQVVKGVVLLLAVSLSELRTTRRDEV